MKQAKIVSTVLICVFICTCCFANSLISPAPSINADEMEEMTDLNQKVTTRTSEVKTTPQSAAATLPWTIMVYMDADNNLESAGIDDINEMELAGTLSAANVIVQIDRTPRYDTSNNNWATTRRYFIRGDTSLSTISSPMISEIGEANMGYPGTLADFIGFCQGNFPAQNYMLILWDHGSGVMNGANEGIVCYDETSGDGLTVTEIYNVLQGRNIAVLGFDACYMASTEVYSMLRNVCPHFIGSEKTEPGDGWPYDTILKTLAQNPGINVQNFATLIPKLYIGAYPPTESLTLSTVYGGPFIDLYRSTNTFTNALMSNLAVYKPTLLTIRAQVQKYDSSPYIDFYDYVLRVKNAIPALASPAQGLLNMITACVMQNSYTASVPNSHGMSIYFPTERTQFTNVYTNSYWASQTYWDEFLLSYYGAKIADDQFETNNANTTAAAINPKEYKNLVYNDYDWYKIELAAGQTLNVTMDFYNATGMDLDLFLYNSTSALVDSSQSVYRTEQVDYITASTQTMYLLVKNYGSIIGFYYNLSVKVALNDDIFENNDYLLAAANLNAYLNTTLHLSAFDLDWYNFTANDDALVRIQMDFDGLNGSLALDVYHQVDEMTFDLLVSIGSATNEIFYQFGTTDATATSYILCITNYENNTDYSLNINVNYGADDMYEDNDDGSSNPVVTFGSYNNLVCIDSDYYDIALTANAWVNISLQFSVYEGDLDLYLYDQDWNEVASAWFWADNECIIFHVSTSGTYIIDVEPYEINLHYNMTIRNNQAFFNDAYDVNNDYMAQNASFPAISVGSTYKNLSAWDVDFYQVSLTEYVEYGFAAIFNDSLGVLAMILFDANGNQLNLSYTASANEYIFYTPYYTGSFWIMILPLQRMASYDLYVYQNHKMVLPDDMTCNVTQTAPATMQFSSYINAQDGYCGVEWVFGDNNTSNLANLTYIYSNPGNYSVMFTVDEYGEYHTYSAEIWVWFNPTSPVLQLDGVSPLAVCSFRVMWNQDINIVDYSLYLSTNHTSPYNYPVIAKNLTVTEYNCTNFSVGTYYFGLRAYNPYGYANASVLKVEITNNTDAGLKIFMVVTSGSYQAGQPLDIQVTLENIGTVNLRNIVINFERSTSEYTFQTGMTSNFTFESLPVGQSKVFTIRVFLTNTTTQVKIRGRITADNLLQDFIYPLTQGRTTDPLVYVFAATGAAAVAGGGGYYGMKKKKGGINKSISGRFHPDKNASNNEPSFGGNNSEFKF